MYTYGTDMPIHGVLGYIGFPEGAPPSITANLLMWLCQRCADSVVVTHVPRGSVFIPATLFDYFEHRPEPGPHWSREIGDRVSALRGSAATAAAATGEDPSFVVYMPSERDIGSVEDAVVSVCTSHQLELHDVEFKVEKGATTCTHHIKKKREKGT